MRKYIIFFALLAGFASTAVAGSYGQNHELIQKRFQGNPLETTAKDAVWTSPDLFKVGVIDDRTSRDGYAAYVCDVLNENGFRGKDVGVQIIDIVQLTRNKKWIKLGEARCR